MVTAFIVGAVLGLLAGIATAYLDVWFHMRRKPDVWVRYEDRDTEFDRTPYGPASLAVLALIASVFFNGAPS